MPPKLFGGAVTAAQLVEVRLDRIHFTQDSISPKFSDGRSFDSTIEALREGTLNFGDGDTDLPRLNVVEFGGHYLSLDNRRLHCVKRAFEHEPRRMLIVWVKPLAGPTCNEFMRKFTTGLNIEVRGRIPPGLDQAGSSASDLIAPNLTREEIEEAQRTMRKEYDQLIDQLRREADQKDRLLEQHKSRADPDNDRIEEAVIGHLNQAGYLDAAGILGALDSPPSLVQMERALHALVGKGKVVRKGSGDSTFRYGVPNAPWAHSQLDMSRDGESGCWRITSSTARRFHCDLDGPSLSEQGAYVACSLSPQVVGCNSSAVVRLSGTWSGNDKLLLGVWPSDTVVDDLFCSPGEKADGKSSLKLPPGHWISCSSGYLLAERQRFSPHGWEPPSKKDGIRWGVLLFDGRLQFAFAQPGELLDFDKSLQWSGDYDLQMRPDGLTIAVLLQPHNRRDDSTARLVVEEVDYFSIA